MTIPLLSLLKSGPPPPKVVVLPDALFFTRTVPVVAGATAADVAEQVELALEALSPFPPAQLYHGFFWPPGAARALVFAAYRRRFPSEQVAEWDNAELVMPAFATLLGGEVKPGTTLVVPSNEGLTAMYWDDGPVPGRVVFRPLLPEATDADRTAARDELLQTAPAGRQLVLAAPPTVDASRNDHEFAFRAEGFVSRLAGTQAAALDVRDKAALAALRRARGRDLALWRGFLGCIAALLLLALGEFALVGLGLWQKTRVLQADAQRPVVEKIMTAQNLTTRINELSTKRLLPLEMISLVSEKKPAEVTFLRSSTVGLYALNIEAYATSPAAVSAYRAALEGQPAFEKVEVRDQRTRDNVMNFTLAVAFKPEQLKPAASPP